MSTNNNSSSHPWVKVLLKLPASLIFIVILNTTLLKEMVKLYIEQNKTTDELKVYTLAAIGVIVLVNLLILGTFAFIRASHDWAKRKEFSAEA